MSSVIQTVRKQPFLEHLITTNPTNIWALFKNRDWLNPQKWTQQLLLVQPHIIGNCLQAQQRLDLLMKSRLTALLIWRLFSSRGRYIVRSPLKHISVTLSRCLLSRKNTVKLRCIKYFEAHTDKITSVVCHSTSPYIATSSRDKSFKIWKINTDSTMTCVANIAGIDNINCCAFHPKALLLAVCTKTLNLWRFSSDPQFTINSVAKLEVHRNYIYSVAFHEKLRYMASCSNDRSIVVWQFSDDYSSVASVKNMEAPFHVNSVAWHPTQPVLATCDMKVYLWRILPDFSVVSIATLELHTNRVMSAMFHQELPFFATGSYDKTTQLYRIVVTDSSICVEHLATLSGHNNKVVNIRFHRRAPFIVTALEYNPALLWDFSSENIIATRIAIDDYDFSSSVDFLEQYRLITGDCRGRVKFWE
jgi:WD40 repeat protein